MFRQRMTAPVSEGEEIDVQIEAVGEKGDGVAKKDGFVLFVPNTKTGDEVRIKVTRVLKKVGFAEVIGQASGPVAKDEAAEEPKEEEPEIDTSNDSEDFGEEPAEETPAEPAEEKVEAPEKPKK